MIEIPVYSVDGQTSGKMKLDEQLLGGEVRPALLKQAYVMFHANRRQGSAANRGRSDKEGSTRKLYRQKGTGRARRGNVRTNVMRGGGVAFAKRARDFRQAMPVKMRRLANRNALLSKIQDQEIRVVDDFGIDQPKTARFAEILHALKINRTCLLAVGADKPGVTMSARNIADITTIQIDQINAYDLLSRRFLLVEKDVLQNYLDGLAATSRQPQEAA